MTYLIEHLWPYMILAVCLGFVATWINKNQNGPNVASPIWTFFALIMSIIAAIIIFTRIMPGTFGLIIESMIFLSLSYFVGSVVGYIFISRKNAANG